VVIDSGPPGGGMTARTTAHLTNALDDRWYEMISLRGEEDAALAAEAHSAAIDLIESIQRRENIGCDFARVDGFLFLAEDDEPKTLDKELDAAHRVGLTDVVRDASAPLSGSGPCLRFPNQGRFHPLKYLRGLISCIARDGGEMLTGHVASIESGKPAIIKVEGGFEIKATHVVVATNVPINDRVAVHTKQAPYRTYVIAGQVPKDAVPDALIWDTGWPYHYVRLQPASDGTSDVVIVGGEDHKSGQADDMDERFERLEQWARSRIPALGRITWRWSGQVMESVDFLGFLGRNPGKNENVYIISGDSGQGMTHTTIGGMIISDLILGNPNRWRELFDPGRMTLKAAGTYARENLNVAAQMTEHVRPGDVSSIADIAPGSGAVIRRGTHKIAVYKSADSLTVERSAVCPHLGCVVAWNSLECCWDCPCHGSQFAADGTVINGPATSDLAALKTEQAGHKETSDNPRHAGL
jgi:glycine/D-amino acid oxidase-like deaminating enzyme/nitrite reductase/ring-hydroxylating ferredoxin subunit